MAEPSSRGIHSCACSSCQLDPQGAIAREHRQINQLVATFDEKSRRLYVAFLANQQGRGGLGQLASITGLSRNTIRRGQQELLHTSPDSIGRIRHQGGGRKRLEKKRPYAGDRPGKINAGCHRRRSHDGVEVDA